jgi:hypothetical protein
LYLVIVHEWIKTDELGDIEIEIEKVGEPYAYAGPATMFKCKTERALEKVVDFLRKKGIYYDLDIYRYERTDSVPVETKRCHGVVVEFDGQTIRIGECDEEAERVTATTTVIPVVIVDDRAKIFDVFEGIVEVDSDDALWEYIKSKRCSCGEWHCEFRIYRLWRS